MKTRRTKSKIAGLRRSLEARAGWTKEDLKALRQRHRSVADKQNSMANMMGMPQTPSGGLEITLMTSQSKLDFWQVGTSYWS